MKGLIDPSANTTNAVLLFRTSDDYKEHIVCIDGYANGSVLCKKFYKIDDYVCLEDVKIKSIVYSEREPVDLISDGSIEYNDTFVTKYISDFSNPHVECFKASDNKMIRKEKFMEGNSFKEEPNGIEWAFITEDEALQIANEKHEEFSKKNRAINMESIPEITNNLYEAMIDYIYRHMNGLYRFFTSKEAVRKKHPKIKFDFEGLVREHITKDERVLVDLEVLVRVYFGELEFTKYSKFKK